MSLPYGGHRFGSGAYGPRSRRKICEHCEYEGRGVFACDNCGVMQCSECPCDCIKRAAREVLEAEMERTK